MTDCFLETLLACFVAVANHKLPGLTSHSDIRDSRWQMMDSDSLENKSVELV